MSRMLIRLLPQGCFLLTLAVLLAGGFADTARAQGVTVFKQLCSPEPCTASGPTTSVGLNVPVHYQITLANTTASAQSVNINETFPPGFIFGSATCSTLPSPTTLSPTPALVPGAGGTTSFGAITLPPGSASAPGPTITCTIIGSFAQVAGATGSANNTATVVSASSPTTVLGTSNGVNAVVNPNLPLPTDLAVSKTTSTVGPLDVSGGPGTITYTITITNTGSIAVFLGPNFQVQDQVSIPSTGVPVSATFGTASCTSTAGSDCLNTTPVSNAGTLTVDSSSWMDLVSFGFGSSAGVLQAGGSITLTYTVTVAGFLEYKCVKQLYGDMLLNSAHIVFNVGGSAVAISDTNPANNTSSSAGVTVTTGQTVVNPDCGRFLKVTKRLVTSQPLNGFPWGSVIEYDIEVHNVTGQPLSNIKLIDWVKEGLGTPPFTAGVAVAVHSCSHGCTQTTTSPPQSLTYYFDTKQMFETTIAETGTATPSLPPGAIAKVAVSLVYERPACVSYPAIQPQPVINLAVASVDVRELPADPPNIKSGISEEIVAYMAPTERCPFKVTKAATGPTTLVFGQSIDYEVTFANDGPDTLTVGTMVDMLRITTANYAVQLPVNYSYYCEATGGVTGFTAPGAQFPVSNSGTIQVSFTSLPQQGVKVIQNAAPVVFPSGSMVRCKISVTISAPSAGDPYCSASAALQNSAVMDMSASYDSNLPWPPGTAPGNWATVSQPLPKCFDLVVNKRVVQPGPPPWTSQNGGPLIYEMAITNNGDPIVAGSGIIPAVSDVFNPYYPGAPVGTISCVPASPACVASWSPAPPASPSSLRVNALGNGQSVVVKFSLLGPYSQNPPPSQICNDAQAAWGKEMEGEWYWKHPDTLHTRLCVPVLAVAPLEVVKRVNVTAPAIAPATTFVIDVVCTLGGQPYGPSPTLTFQYPPSPSPQTVPTIPIGSMCRINEHPLPAAPVVSAGCPSGYAAWGPIAYLNPPGPDSTTSSVGITSGTNSISVDNTFACTPPPPGVRFVAGQLVCNTQFHRWEYHLTGGDLLGIVGFRHGPLR